MPPNTNQAAPFGHTINLTSTTTIPTDLRPYSCTYGPYPCSVTAATSNQLTLSIAPLSSPYNQSSLSLAKDARDVKVQK